MGDIGMYLVLGAVGLYALYAYNQGALGTTDTGITDTGTTYTDPASGEGIPETNAQCQAEGGVWQGICCSCPNMDCDNKCGVTKVNKRDVCVHEGGTYKPNALGINNKRGCCSCPNLDCSDKCGAAQNLSGCGGDDPDCDITPEEIAEGVCKSSAAAGVNEWDSSKNCCDCPSGTCLNACKSRKQQAAQKAKPSGRSGGSPRQRTGAGGSLKVPVTLKKPAAKPCPSRCASLKNSPGTYDKCCKSGYAKAYLGSAFNRRGPSYNYRDDFRHLTNVEFPTPIDFQYESMYRPNWLGAGHSPERHELIRRFQSNFAQMRFSN